MSPTIKTIKTVFDDSRLYLVCFADNDHTEYTVDIDQLTLVSTNYVTHHNGLLTIDGKSLAQIITAQENVSYIDGNRLNNQKINLSTNIVQIQKRKTDSDLKLPKYINYRCPTDGHGEHFTVEINRNGKCLINKRTTQSKSVSLEDKLLEAKHILVSTLTEHPEWGVYSELLNTSLPEIKSTKTNYLPSGMSTLPKHVGYIKATASRGDGYFYDLKSPEGRIYVKSSLSKYMSLDDKYEDLRTKLASRSVLL